MGFVQGRTGTKAAGFYRAAWIYLLAAIVCGTAGLIINKVGGDPSKLSRHAVLELGGLVIVLWVGAAVLLLFAVSRFNRARHSRERDRNEASERRLAAEHLTRAGRLAEQLLAGEVPVVGQVWDVVLQPGEWVLLDGSAGYSRYYGIGSAAAQAGSTTRHSGRASSGTAPAGPAVSRARRRPKTPGPAPAAAPRWRDEQQSRVLVTDRRLLCEVQAKGWVAFDHAAASAIKAGPGNGAVVVEYPDSAPVRLSGPVAAEILVVVVWVLYGVDGLREHPALAELRSSLPAASIRGGMETATSNPVDAEAPKAPAATMNAERSGGGDRQAPGDPRLDLLTFVAAHELVLAEHAAVLLGLSELDAAERLENLVEEGLVARVRLSAHTPVLYRVTQHGADQVDPALPPLRPLDLAGYRRAVALPGLWLAARSGVFGQARKVLTARQMHAAGTRERTEPRSAAEAGVHASSGDAHHGVDCADLAILLSAGGVATADLILKVPDQEDLVAMIDRADRENLIVEQWFVVEDERAGELIEALAAVRGGGDRVRVQVLDLAAAATAGARR